MNRNINTAPMLGAAQQRRTDNTGFWIIWNPLSSSAPSKRFYSAEQARAVARQMADDFRGETFYVMRAEGVALLPATPVDSYTAF